MINLARSSLQNRQLLNGLIIVVSVLLCIFLSLTRLPGMELLGIGPNWLVIWLITWSFKRRVFDAVVAGLTLGLIQDGITSTYPSHVLVLVIIGYLTARIRKQRYAKEHLMSVVLIVFVMTLLAESLMAFQYVVRGILPLEQIWPDYQKIALSSAILSSLWTPILYYPLSRWWDAVK